MPLLFWKHQKNPKQAMVGVQIQRGESPRWAQPHPTYLSSSLLPNGSDTLIRSKTPRKPRTLGLLGPPIPTVTAEKPSHGSSAPPKPSQPARGAGLPYHHPTSSEMFVFRTRLLLYLHPRPPRAMSRHLLLQPTLPQQELMGLKWRPSDTKYHVSGLLPPSLGRDAHILL